MQPCVCGVACPCSGGAFLFGCRSHRSGLRYEAISAEPLVGAANWPAWQGQIQTKEQGMATGTVKWFNSMKGYGFIEPDDGGKDVFVHISAVERADMRALNEGQKISYEIATEGGKTSAANLAAVD